MSRTSVSFYDHTGEVIGILMSEISLKRRLGQSLLLLDGAMGAQLIACGIGPEHIEAVAKELK